jgi:hypothetical protein
MENATQSADCELAAKTAAQARSIAPVFVVGCPRSGTTFLYHILLSAGNFAVYRAESQAFHLLEPRFGDLGRETNQRKLLAAWFESRLFTATGLDRATLEQAILQDCRNGGDFLRIVMESVARQQRVHRWAECTPDHILFLPRIRATIPGALVIHIIRDGRDVALSMERQGWPNQLPWDRRRRSIAGALYWEWMIRRGRRDGAELGDHYIEVHYEDLVANPHEVLRRLGIFIGQELDYDQIQRVGIGSVRRPNSSFEDAVSGFSPVGRWKQAYSPEETELFETLVGRTLRELGYECGAEGQARNFASGWLRAEYEAFFESKFFLKTKTLLGKFLVTRNLANL